MPTKPTSKLNPDGKSGGINRERHLANKMPAKPTVEQRVHRHIEHAKHCKCREMPESIKKLIKQAKK